MPTAARVTVIAVATAAIIGLVLYELAPGIVGLGLFYAIELHRDCLTRGCI